MIANYRSQKSGVRIQKEKPGRFSYNITLLTHAFFWLLNSDS